MNKFSGLTTKRLRLRDFQGKDLDTFTAYRSDPNVARYQSWQDYDKLQAKVFYLQQNVLRFGKPGSWYQIAIADIDSDRLLGDCVIHFIEDDDAQVEIGFTIAPENQAKGYAKETMEALLGLIFTTLNKHRVRAVVDVRNEPSVRLLESIGFRREAHFIENVFFKGQWGSEYHYGMLQREFIVR